MCIRDRYCPAYLWIPKEEVNNFSYKPVFELFDYVLLKTNYQIYPINEKLQLLMTTSGSTGSPKLVRYKKGNLEANARNVATAFGWTKEERPICDLGMQYTMGLNVINTHLYVGATLLLTTYNLISSEFWEDVYKRQLPVSCLFAFAGIGDPFPPGGAPCRKCAEGGALPSQSSAGSPRTSSFDIRGRRAKASL